MATVRSVQEGPLTVWIVQDGDFFGVSAWGEIDSAAAASALEGALRSVLDRDATSIVLDVTNVGCLDEAGVRVLMWAAARSGENGDRLDIRCGAGAMRGMIGLPEVKQHPVVAA